MTTEKYSEKLKASGTDSEKVRDRLNNTADRIQAQLDSLLAIVGSDHFGSQFIDGPKGLKARLEGSVKGTRSQAKSWNNLADGQFKSADVAKKNEDMAAEAIRQAQARRQR
ncbi:hypothetical protein [Nocardia sp. NPDC049707]|uniref:hypothetical protein n=1 Tax=Nocardia sp. NPDC049707 TaxID=3154735 RepID=UPI0034470DC7